MPTITTLYGILIQMFWNDHPPAHFHVRYADSLAASVSRSLRFISGSLPRTAERLVLKWAQLHQAELIEMWLYADATREDRSSSMTPVITAPIVCNYPDDVAEVTALEGFGCTSISSME